MSDKLFNLQKQIDELEAQKRALVKKERSKIIEEVGH
jgi:hypothetical protein